MSLHIQPREIAEIKGAVRKHPERYRKTPPEVLLELGTAPEHLSDEAKVCWFEIETYAPVAVLRGADRIALELLANLVSEYRMSPDLFPTNKIGHIISLLARLGMSPADRQKLGVEKPKGSDSFQEF